MNGNAGNERSPATGPDPLRPHAPRVPLGSRRAASSARRWPPCWRKTGSSPRSAAASEPEPSAASPLAPKAPHFPAKAKACIVLFMYGGVSQVDTFDPKPELTKHNGKPIPTLDSDPVLKVRNPGMLLGSSRKFARHGQAGIDGLRPVPAPGPVRGRHGGHPQHVHRQLRARLGPAPDEHGLPAPGVSRAWARG